MSWLRSLWARIFRKRDKNRVLASPKSDLQALAAQPAPQDAAGWQGEARVLAELGHWEGAIPCLDKAIDLDPQCATAWYDKGRYLGALGRLEEAIDCYGQALILDPKMAAGWFGKALAEEKLGRTQDAIQSYEQYFAVGLDQDAEQIEYVRHCVRDLRCGEDRTEPPVPSGSVRSSPPTRHPPQELSVEGETEPATQAEPVPIAPRPHHFRLVTTAVVEGDQEDDRIGEFEVHGVLGRGGFGVVYLVHLPTYVDIASLETFRDEDLPSRGRRSDRYVTYALKTLLDPYLAVPEVRQRFRHEAQMLVDLERHPHLLQADFVDEIAGRLYIATEYVAPNAEGLNSLEGYLQQQPPDLTQSLRWAIQVCYGMEYAYSRGLRCHRDLKPANILITRDLTVKIADFGLAGVLEEVRLAEGIQVHTEAGRIGLSAQTVEGAGFGTPTHMPPEQFTSAASCDERSDVYAFGVVLYQMATGGKLPFLAALPRGGSLAERRRFWAEMHQLHRTAPVPQLNTPLFPIIERCLAKEPAQRCQSFSELREALEPLLRRETGEVVQAPVAGQLTAGEWHIKAYSLAAMGHWEKAIECYDRSLALESQHAATWTNKGNCLAALGWREEAIACHEHALALNPLFADAWNNKGTTLTSLEKREEAIASFDQALALNPLFAEAWNNKGMALLDLGRREEAIACFDQALALAPQNAMQWSNNGLLLARLGRQDEALACFDQALTLNPRLADAWSSKAETLAHLGRHREAIDCCDRALALHPQHIVAWTNKGANLSALGRRSQAIACYDRVLALDPHEATAWNNKANNLAALGRTDEAMTCYEKALALDPEYAHAWRNKGNTLLLLDRQQEALACFDRTLHLDPQDASVWTNKGAILADLGRVEEARACFESALASDPLYANAWFIKALGEDRVGRWRDAVRSYEQFLVVASPQDVMQIQHARRRLRDLGR